MPDPQPHADHPLFRLGREDLDLIAALVLKSGSIKDLASSYAVSYPTIRARLDRTIARLQDAMAGREPDPVTELLASLVERGELTPAGAKSIRDAVRQAQPSPTPDAARPT